MGLALTVARLFNGKLRRTILYMGFTWLAMLAPSILKVSSI